MMGIGITSMEFLLLVATLVAMATRRLRIPYTVGLVIAGLGLAGLHQSPAVHLTKDLIFTLFLPPLVFEAALYLRWREFKRDLAPVAVLASVGFVLAAGVSAAGMHYAIGWPWETALIFGSLIAATDPVSVIALFKEAGVEGRLRLLVEAESLLNDSTAAIGLSIALAFATGQTISAGSATAYLLWNIAGGIAAGTIVTGALLFLAGRTADHLVEITITTVAAYGSFLLADRLGCSGVLASMTAGLLVGNVGIPMTLTDKGREGILSFWEYVTFVVNSLIFLLIGYHEPRQNHAGLGMSIVAGIIAVGVGRMVTVYLLCGLFSRSKRRVAVRDQHVLVWAGLRGAMAMALALGLPADLAFRREIVTVTFAVVTVSIVMQGLTMGPLLRRLGITSSQGNHGSPGPPPAKEN
jgi:CPA1 family monovalent cation:H+ antiporter